MCNESIRMRKLLNKALERNQLFWFLMLAVMKIFQIEKFLRDFVFGSRPSTCRFLINRFLIKKACSLMDSGTNA